MYILPETGSTNDHLSGLVDGMGPQILPEFTVVATDSQTAGRGRLGRSWAAPSGTMLAASVLLYPHAAGIAPFSRLGWLPLIAGLAMTRSLASMGATTELKWPNDVLINEKKVCGILAEVVGAEAVVIGSGVNLAMSEDQLPVPTATSMSIVGAGTDPDWILATYLREFRTLYTSFAACRGDADASGIQMAVADACSTIGRIVRVQLPGAKDLVGLATGLDESGRLVVESDGRRTAVSAGDVTHLRY
ncbi:biotin--[acetyl-CoA-carboxylase] ligase [Rathayibacter sp. KR2-224]|uniref:biotin--[acetyl-CoA-carboxylase] ligase n=1 Tax=Rathayibacter sp. KR2-224 TaxID=3400913 RepID=UPI003BFBCE00